MEQLAHHLKGVSDPTRLRIIRLLDAGELCVCDIMAGLGLPQSTVSRHMAFLKKADWVSSRRSGKWIYYTLATPKGEIQALILQVLQQKLRAMTESRQDYARLVRHLETKHPDSCHAQSQ